MLEQKRERSFYSNRIRDLADQVLQDAQIDSDPETRPVADDELAVHALETHLRENYGYTLEITAAPAGRDATEHFLFNSREGHCEYFASALASMCRAVGVEARVVTGYVAVEYVEGAGKYVVRESNAHAWVEAPLDRGRWITVDATPPAILSEIHRPRSGLIARARRVLDSLELAWIHGVVGFDERQRASMLGQEPLNPARVERRVSEFNMRMSVGGLSLAARAARNALVTFAGVTLAGIGISAMLSGVKLRRIGMPLVRRRLLQQQSSAPPEMLRLFDRLQATLARKRVARPIWAGALDHTIQVAKSDAAADALPDVVRLYYAARFGGRHVDRDALRAAQADLAKASREMVRKKRTRARPRRA